MCGMDRVSRGSREFLLETDASTSLCVICIASDSTCALVLSLCLDGFLICKTLSFAPLAASSLVIGCVASVAELGEQRK